MEILATIQFTIRRSRVSYAKTLDRNYANCRVGVQVGISSYEGNNICHIWT
jgi:hypothetical protein